MLDEFGQRLDAGVADQGRAIGVFAIEVFGDQPAIEHELAVVLDHRQALGAALGAVEDAGEAARHDVHVEALVREGVLGGPDEGADGAAGRELQIVERDGVVLGH